MHCFLKPALGGLVLDSVRSDTQQVMDQISLLQNFLVQWPDIHVKFQEHTEHSVFSNLTDTQNPWLTGHLRDFIFFPTKTNGNVFSLIPRFMHAYVEEIYPLLGSVQ